MADLNTVKVGKIPGRIVEVAVNGGTTVDQVIEVAGIGNIEGYEKRLNGSIVEGDSVVSNGDVILLVQQIKGN